MSFIQVHLNEFFRELDKANDDRIKAGIAAVKAVAAAFCKNALRSIFNMSTPGVS